jgi:ferritin-like metal-binding protein YciE
MKNQNKSIITLHDLLDFDARKFYHAEIQLRNILPEWTNRVTNLKLQDVLHKYHANITHQVGLLEGFFTNEKFFPLAGENRVMRAFIEELSEKLSSCADAPVRDACLLAGIQEINHYKISLYGTAAAFTGQLGMADAAEIFRQAEIHEKQTDDRLSQLAGFEVNAAAKTPLALPS